MYTDSDGDIHISQDKDIYEGYVDRSGQIGPFFARRNRWSKAGLTLYGHLEGAITNWAWAGSPFSSITPSYSQNSYLFGTTSDTDGAFYCRSVSGTAIGKVIAARVCVYYDSVVGVRIDDGTDDNFCEWYLSDSGGGYLDLVTRWKSDDDSVAVTVNTYDVRWSPSEYCDLYLEAQDRGGGEFRQISRLILESGHTAITTASAPNFSWTIDRVGLIIKAQTCSTRGGYADWIAGTFTF
jgi:hypothetical protein